MYYIVLGTKIKKKTVIQFLFFCDFLKKNVNYRGHMTTGLFSGGDEVIL